VNPQHRRIIVNNVFLFAVYFLTAKFGLTLDAVSGFATLVWPPSGIALAALFIFGYELWPGILAGAFLVNFLSGAPVLAACGIGLGNTCEAFAGTFLLKRVAGFQPSLERVRDVAALVLLAAFASTAVSATLGVSSLWLGRVVALASYPSTWWAWWIGDMLGVLIAGSFLFVWISRFEIYFPRTRNFEFFLLILFSAGVGCVVFCPFFGDTRTNAPIAYVLFLPLIWAGLRFGSRGAVTATLLTSIVTIAATLLGSGPFVRAKISESLTYLQLFMGVASVTSMILAATVSERRRAETGLREAVQRLRHLDEQKSTFIALASHELQTPLTSISGFVSLFLTGKIGPMSDEQKKYLSLIKESIDRIHRMVEDLLDITKIELGHIRMEKKPRDIRKLLREEIAAFKVQGDAKEIRIEEEIEEGLPEIACDQDRIKEVVDNLISNAVKYTPRKGSIRVRAKRAGQWVQIDVEDSGIGIKMADHERIFEPFQHLKKAGLEGEKSTGLGLALVKTIIEAHQGEVMLQSEEGKGATFSIRLPTPLPPK